MGTITISTCDKCGAEIKEEVYRWRDGEFKIIDEQLKINAGFYIKDKDSIHFIFCKACRNFIKNEFLVFVRQLIEKNLRS